MAVTQNAFERTLQGRLEEQGYDLNLSDTKELLELIGKTIEECLADDMKAARKLGWAKAKKPADGSSVKNPVVIVRGIGRFRVSHRSARMGRNPRTGEKMKVAASQKMNVRPHTSTKEALGLK